MALSPERFRLAVAIGIFAVLGGAVYWVTRFPLPSRRYRTIPTSGFDARTNGRANVEGLVIGADGKPARADVSLVIESAPVPMRGGPVRGRRAAVTRTGDDGKFSMTMVGAGHYVVVARSLPTSGSGDDTETASQWAAAELDATNGAKTNIQLTLKRGGAISGHLALEVSSGRGGAITEALTNATLSIEPMDSDAKATLLDGVPRVTPRGDGSFIVPDVPPGRYQLTADVPAPWVLDQVSVGGHDQFGLAVKVEPGATLAETAITATDTPNVLTGEAHDPAGQPAAFALIFAFPVEPEARTTLRREQATRADRRGRFSFAGLPSGAYLVATAPAGTPETWYSPAFLASLVKGATTVHLTAGVPGVALLSGVQK